MNDKIRGADYSNPSKGADLSGAQGNATPGVDLTTGQPDLRERAASQADDLATLDAATPTEASPGSQWNPRNSDIVTRNQDQPERKPFASVLRKDRPRTTQPGESGYTGDLTVCVDNGDGTFTQGTAHFANGLLISVETDD